MSWFRWQDLVWLVLFGALVWVSPLKNTGEIEMLAAMALLQIAVPRIPALNTSEGTAVVIGLKLLISFLLIAVTKSTDSEYTLILFLPILSAATRYGALGTSVVTVLACATYLAMWPLAVLAWGHYFEPEDVQNILLRVLFFPLVAYLTYGLAESNRNEARRAQAAVQELAMANERLREVEASVRRSERLAESHSGALRESEQLFRSIFEESPLGKVLVEPRADF